MRIAATDYRLAAGDEPAAIIELYRFARTLGFQIVAAGKGKNNPLDIHAVPKDLEQKARARRMSASMLCEFVDGSKTAAAEGLLPLGLAKGGVLRRSVHQDQVLHRDDVEFVSDSPLSQLRRELEAQDPMDR